MVHELDFEYLGLFCLRGMELYGGINWYLSGKDSDLTR